MAERRRGRSSRCEICGPTSPWTPAWSRRSAGSGSTSTRARSSAWSASPARARARWSARSSACSAPRRPRSPAVRCRSAERDLLPEPRSALRQVRRRDRDDLPGPDDLVQPGPQHRRSRSPRRSGCTSRSRAGGPDQDHRAPAPRRDAQPRGALQAVPARVLRRDAAARHDRHGHGQRAEGASSPTSRRPPSTSPSRPRSSRCCRGSRPKPTRPSSSSPTTSVSSPSSPTACSSCMPVGSSSRPRCTRCSPSHGTRTPSALLASLPRVDADLDELVAIPGRPPTPEPATARLRLPRALRARPRPGALSRRGPTAARGRRRPPQRLPLLGGDAGRRLGPRGGVEPRRRRGAAPPDARRGTGDHVDAARSRPHHRPGSTRRRAAAGQDLSVDFPSTPA